MATIILGAAGAAIGGGFGGTVVGLSGAVVGRALGATLGRAIDQRLLGAGSQKVETGRVERFRLSSAGEGTPVAKVWGTMRVGGQVIWSTRFRETTRTEKSGKGTGPSVETTRYTYSVSLALALCEGEILRVGRIWADGKLLDTTGLNVRVYRGDEGQLPDPKIEAVEGAGQAPSYRGVAYVVFEDLPLGRFGNRVPQFSFEVYRAAQSGLEGLAPDISRGVEGVALIPGTGEYALSTTTVYYRGEEGGASVAVNQNAPGGLSDFETSLVALDQELPNCGATSLVVSWFGDDLRAGECSLHPRVNQTQGEGKNMPWRVSGIDRGAAGKVASVDGNDVYGGTPADAGVIEAIRALRVAGKFVTFYPFILMDQLAGNGRTDPWTGAPDQPVLPWRGRITTHMAPDRPDTTDGTDAALEEVARFFGNARPEEFEQGDGTIRYTGPEEWSMRRFILHYAHLCAAAGGVDAFCIGTEMRSLTQIRGPQNSFPAVAAFRTLAADVRKILPDAKIGYAADWSEYFGYQPGNGDRFFHLDPLWADPAIDFIGIDNYLPISDWRDGEEHADAHWGSIYNLEYLKANIAGGELYDWYYANDAHRAAQIRTPVTDGAANEPWIWRPKDIRNWWENRHYERVDGVRASVPTDWIPQSKPVWFTEYGCAAIDKGTNQPNKFLDPKSSESQLPRYSSGRRDEVVQMQYLRAMIDYWGDAHHNPVSDLYGGPMVDMSRAHVWCWDTRPWPQFPANDSLWTDADNYARGHWISGRAVAQPLAFVVAEICAQAGVWAIDVSRLYGSVRGYSVTAGDTPRAMLQSLMLAYGFDAVERDGVLQFRMRDGRVDAHLNEAELALGEAGETLSRLRSPEAEIAGRVRLSYIEAEGDFSARVVEAILPAQTSGSITAGSELALALHRPSAVATVERWLAEARVARDSARFALPPSLGHLGAGDIVALHTAEGASRYRIDRVEGAGLSLVDAVRVEPKVYEPSDAAEASVRTDPFVPPVPVSALFLDLPLLEGTEDPIAPHLAVSAKPWPGTVAVFSSSEDDDYQLNTTLAARATIGTTLNALGKARIGVWDRGPALRIKLQSGALESVSAIRVLNGANVMAIGDGVSDHWEVFQFANARMLGPDQWEVSLRLRGQAGTDGVMPDSWPAGSRVVLLDQAPTQIDLPRSARNLARHYRIGSAGRPYDDPSFEHVVRSFSGVGLRPLSPVHLRAVRQPAGWRISWIRRTRKDGDSWESYDVPLAETQERYMLRVRTATGQILRQVEVASTQWSYSAAMRAQDASAGAVRIEVAQISDLFGPGLFAELWLDEDSAIVA
ncbi:host specificity protein [Rhodobacteraceae bacterium]|nr:host specificity protein [Paracoccaceae bacterium]